MSSEFDNRARSVSGFRLRIFVAMLLVIGGISATGVIATHRYLLHQAENDLKEWINRQISAAAHTRAVRQAVLTRICGGLAREPRIHAALEDDALDLLYPSAANELRQIRNLDARFYRFLDTNGTVIEPESDEPRMPLPEGLVAGQPEYLLFSGDSGSVELIEIYTVPIISNETLMPIASLVVGFPYEAGSNLPERANLHSGVWMDDFFDAPALSASIRHSLAGKLEDRIGDNVAGHYQAETMVLAGVKHRIVLKPLNPDSPDRIAHEVFVASMEDLSFRQSRMRGQILSAAGLLALIGLCASHILARRLAAPVETELDSTHRKLERAARYSSDASHQLKTPLTVVRAGLEELNQNRSLSRRLRKEVHSLIRQTDRLTTVIDDLLLLSRLDAGHLALNLHPMRLRDLVDSLLDDFSILPNADRIHTRAKVGSDILILGDTGHTSLILQCLLENARKYNRADGWIHIAARRSRDSVVCRVGNNGPSIPQTSQPHIFDRFHRGPMAEDVPGYGLGLNLARELTRLHGGSLSLLRSHDDWTEFELILQSAP